MKTQRWQQGAELDGFTLFELIQTGGMGAVFRVTKPGLTLPAVMKLPRLDVGQASEAIVAFQTEVAITRTLKGPHVPAFIAAGDLASTPYLVLEWVEGENLEDVGRRAPLPAPELARVGAALADALHAIHLQQVIHLDFKPSNVILRADGSAVLSTSGSRITRGIRICWRKRHVSARAPRRTSRPSSCSAAVRTVAVICSRSASCCTSWRPASCRSVNLIRMCGIGFGSIPCRRPRSRRTCLDGRKS